MDRSPFLKKGPWTPEEDKLLVDYIQKNGMGNWGAIRRLTGLDRCSKSCRLRWTRHLRTNIKRGGFTDDEGKLIIQLHSILGNKWAQIAEKMPGKTDNDIKNYWNMHLRKKLFRKGIDPNTHRLYPYLSPIAAAAGGSSGTGAGWDIYDLMLQVDSAMNHLLQGHCSVISSSLGAMRSLVGKLDMLLLAPSSRQGFSSKRVKDGMRLLKDDVEEISIYLDELLEVEDPPPIAMCWMNEARELSYDMEDYMDNLLFVPPDYVNNNRQKKKRKKKKMIKKRIKWYK
ncbi:hypothetical protein CFC21_055541 [Triticum aestivum]|uniref:Uncharacterized protein n=2 Tax=Triticum aestivum TaxID=4565 RepID=A0A9R1GHP5_WHEAT|nr:hypothetical protein CFC21_055541 [Triticum aestivum]